jgi:competence protein ComEC
MQPAAAIESAAPARPSGGGAGRLRSWFAANLVAERERWPLWIPVLVGTGIGIYFWLPFEPPTAVAPIALVLAGAAAGAALRFGRLVPPSIGAGAVMLGFAAAELQAWWVAAPILKHRLDPVAVEARLVAVDPLPEATRLILEPKIIRHLDPAELPALIRVKVRHDLDGLIPGAWLRAEAALIPPSAPAMPGAYDFQRRAYFDRLGAVGYTFGDPVPITAPADAGPGPWRTAIEAVRAEVGARIRAALPGPTGAIAAALVTGEKHAIAPADAGAFRDAGLAHILVIAGLHMGMVAAAAFFGLRAGFALVPAIALRHPTKKWAAALAMLLAFLYLLLSGATVPSRRAFVMTGLVLLAVIVDRLSISARAIALAALAVLLLDPESATGPSFQMSFAAVAGLIAFYEALRSRLALWHSHARLLRRIGLYILGIAFTTVITTVATMPFTIYHFMETLISYPLQWSNYRRCNAKRHFGPILDRTEG